MVGHRGRGAVGRQPVRWSGLVGLLCAGLLAGACTPWIDRYLDAASGHATQEDVSQQLGQPFATHTQQDGGAIWIYRLTTAGYAGSTGSSNCTEYVLTFDHRKVLRTWRIKAC